MQMRLPDDASGAHAARRAVTAACKGVAIDLDAIVLCTSELVANAVLHGRPPLELTVDVGDPMVRVEVHDGDQRPVRRREPVTPDTLSGRGLAIVEALAARWGSEVTPTGKVTWFEMRRS